jgi:hypothetical protein
MSQQQQKQRQSGLLFTNFINVYISTHTKRKRAPTTAKYNKIKQEEEGEKYFVVIRKLKNDSRKKLHHWLIFSFSFETIYVSVIFHTTTSNNNNNSNNTK